MGYQILDDEFLERLDGEFKRACQKFRPLNSSHEAYAVILEELQEFWIEVMKKREQRSREAMLKELVQVAAMCWRAANDMGLLSRPSFHYEADHLKPAEDIPTCRTVAGRVPDPPEQM